MAVDTTNQKGMITLKRFISIFLIINILLCIYCPTAYASASTKPDLYSDAAIVIDAKTGQIIFEKNAYAKEYPASITKILTTLIAIENGDMNSTVTVPSDAVWGIDSDSSKMYLNEGEQLSLRDALYGVMLVSANDASWAVAEHIAGSLEAFCDMMNQRAKELGCTGSNFVNSNGLSDKNHYTCAYDMALITREALKNDEFRKLTSTYSYTVPKTNMTEEPRYLTQGNRLVQSDSEYYYKYCEGGKTGYTQDAGGTLVAWAKKGDIELICVTLKTTGNKENYTDTISLFDYCFDNYSYTNPLSDFSFTDDTIIQAENYLNQLYGGTNLGTLELSATLDEPILINNAKFDSLKYELEMSTTDLDNKIIGKLKISDDMQEYISLPVTFSGYINSEDEEAVLAAYADGTLVRPKEKKTHRVLIIFGVIFVILASGIAALYLRMKYVQKKRAEYIKRREKAKKNKQSF